MDEKTIVIAAIIAFFWTVVRVVFRELCANPYSFLYGVLFGCFAWLFCVFRWGGSPNHQTRFGSSLYAFAYQKLKSATAEFSNANLLGEGGFGWVYRGRLSDGLDIAVKRLKHGSEQEKHEFQEEVEIISRVHHRHLVSMLGYCIFERQRLLVFEFVPNNTLDFHLHGEGQPTLDWPTRLKIAIESAKGLAYLHEDCNPKIIHRDIKAANILLDFNFDVKVADFGLAKFISDSKTHITTRIMGTTGYLAPEYVSTGRLTDKSDVFSLGVLLMELITGKLPFDQRYCLVDWARPLLTIALEDGNYNDVIDQRLGVHYNSNEMLGMAACAVACVRDSAESRPQVSKVVRVLEGDASIEVLSRGVEPSHSGSSNYNTMERGMILEQFKKMRVGRYASEIATPN